MASVDDKQFMVSKRGHDARSISSHFNREEILSLLAIILTCWLWMIQHGGVPIEWALLWIIKLIVTLTVWGRLVIVLSGMDRWISRSVPLTTITGVVFVSSFLTAFRMLLGTSLAPLANALALLGVALYLVFLDRIARWHCKHSSRRDSLWVVLLCCLGSTAWTRYFRPSHADFDDVVYFKFIRDYFFHSHAITVLGWDTSVNEPGLFGLAGANYPLYHYSGYAISAWGCQDVGIGSLDQCFCFLLPFAFLTVGLTGGVIASEWFGWRSAIVVTIALTILPDPTLIGAIIKLEPSLSLYSIQRFLQYAPTNGYGFVAAGLALALFSIACRKQRVWPAVLAHFVLALSLFFKAQVFVAAAMLMGLLDITNIKMFLWRCSFDRRAIIAGSISLVAVSSFALWTIIGSFSLSERAPPVSLTWPLGYEFSEFLLWQCRGDRIGHFLALNGVETPGFIGLVWRILLLLFLPFRFVGLIAIAFAIGCQWWSSARFKTIKRRTCPRYLPFAAVVVYLVLALTLAPDRPGYAWGHAWNYQHIPFGWTYFIIAIWSVGTLTALASRQWMAADRIGLLGCLLVAPAILLGGKQLPDNGLTDAEWNNFTAPRGLIDSALFIRGNTELSDLIQDSENDGQLALEAIAQRRAFVGWPVVTTYTSKTKINDVFLARLKQHEEFRQSDEPAEINRFLEDSGVRWYILAPTVDVKWRMKSKNSVVFNSHGYQVIDLKKLAKDLERIP